MGFDTHSLLGQIGYEKGDLLPLTSFGTGDGRTQATTSTSFANGFGQQQLFVTWEDLFDAISRSRVFYGVQIDPGTDETVTAQLYNNTDDEVIAEISGVDTFRIVESGFVDYTPSTTSETIEIFPRLRTEPGNNESASFSPTTIFAIEL